MKSVFWQKHPALRLFIPFSAGIITQSLLAVPFCYILTITLASLILTLVYQYFSIKRKFFLTYANGLILQLLIFNAGLMIEANRELTIKRSSSQQTVPITVATLDEPLSEKQNSFKTVATVRQTDEKHNSTRIIIYFAKDSTLLALQPGSTIVFKKHLEEIRNSGNPGSFDFRKYCLYQRITHQVYLKKEEFTTTADKSIGVVENALHQVRSYILSVIRKYITGKKQQGLAEALLIGYREDLDKSLVQSYANTGVVHVIAVSGLHLGIVYTILVFLTSALNRKGWYWFRFLLVLGGLWSFAVIAGAQASVLRSAVMFSFVAAGVVLKRNGSVINSLALSALLLLCWKPQWIWDVGFQLSYTAVLSIVLFFKHVYAWFYISNKLADILWKMTSVTISAQFLTIPLTLYYFHQFPVLLLFTNLVAVPLSSLVLIGEIVLVAFASWPMIAVPLGSVLTMLIRWMNFFIEKADSLPFNTWQGLQLNHVQVIILYLLISSAAVFIFQKRKKMAFVCILSLLFFLAIRSFSFMQASLQTKLIVYNTPKDSAADLIYGRKYIFIGSPEAQANDKLLLYTLSPARTLHRLSECSNEFKPDVSISAGGKRIYFLSSGRLPVQKPDIVVLGGLVSPSALLLDRMKSSTVVMDGSLGYKVKSQWKQELLKLKIEFHDVTRKGAFVMNL